MNDFDEITGNINQEGRDVNVIEKQITPTVGFGSTLFEILMWSMGFIIASIIFFSNEEMDPGVMATLFICAFIPGLIWLYIKTKAGDYLKALEQKIQANASEIDNYLEQRVVILNNVVGLLEKSIELDKDVMKTVAGLRSGIINNDTRNAASSNIDTAFGSLFPQVEAYPDLKSQATIADAMRQNNYLQQEIRAARTLYNDTVNMWNMDIFDWPAKRIVAARRRSTTRIPFTTSAKTKEDARKTFF
mgnify:CR=1 FL=1